MNATKIPSMSALASDGSTACLGCYVSLDKCNCVFSAIRYMQDKIEVIEWKLKSNDRHDKTTEYGNTIDSQRNTIDKLNDKLTRVMR